MFSYQLSERQVERRLMSQLFWWLYRNISAGEDTYRDTPIYGIVKICSH